MHAALVVRHGCGILFTGASGIGKSTQAALWEQFAGAEIINGDIALVEATAEGITACGTPWHGNSPHYLNKRVPLSMIVVLEQTPHNALRRLTGVDLFSRLLENIFLPPMVADGQNILLGLLDKALRATPVFLLQNRADKESVDMVVEIFDKAPGRDASLM